MKGTPYLNPDPFCRFIGPRNWGEALIDDKLTTCLLDNGSQLNFVTPTYAHERGMDILSLDTLAQEIGGQLPPIAVMGGGMIKPEGFVIMNVRVPCVRGYNEDQIAIVLEDPEMKDCPVVLGTPTLFRVMEVIKESKISELAVPWANSRLSWLMRGVHAKMSRLQVKDVANKPIAPLSVDEVVRVTSKCMVPPFGHKVIHGRVGLVLQGYKMNVMTHGLEKRSPLLPLGLEVQSAYATLATGSSRVPVVLRNNTKDWLEIKKGTPIARMVAANLVPQVINAVSAKGPDPASTLTEAERQDLLLDKVDLSGLDEWPTEQAEKARGLLKEYHDIFFLEKQDMGHTKAAEHKIVLKDPDTPPFEERFRRIPPPQLDWPVYKVRCPSADDRRKPKYRILHRNRLLLVADEDVDDASGQAQAKATPTLPNATHGALSVGVGSQEPLPSLVTRQGGELTSMVWLNGEFRTKPWTQVVSGATPSPPDLDVDEVSGDESTEPEGM